MDSTWAGKKWYKKVPPNSSPPVISPTTLGALTASISFPHRYAPANSRARARNVTMISCSESVCSVTSTASSLSKFYRVFGQKQGDLPTFGCTPRR